MKKLSAADAHLLGNLRGGKLAAGRHAHGQKPLLVVHILAGAQQGSPLVGPIQADEDEIAWG